MSYNMRDRNKSVVYVEPDCDPGCDVDPDYARIQPKRQQTRLPLKSLYGDPRQGQCLQMINFLGGEGSSRDMAGPGRPVKKRSVRHWKNVEAPNQGNVNRVQRLNRREREIALNTKGTRSDSSNGPALWANPEKRTILALLIDSGIVKQDEVVYYCNKSGQNSNVRGKIKRSGILCSCCENIITVSEFQIHSRTVERTMPYNNIVAMASSLSLLQCQALAWYLAKQNGSILINDTYIPVNEDKSDDACIICADGGDLICCNDCPLTFHISCLNMMNVPTNKWVCPCCLCAECGKEGTKQKNISVCTLCGKAYHLACHGSPFMEVSPLCSAFCGEGCINIDKKLKDIVGVKNELGEGFSWTLLHHFDLTNIESLHYMKTECNSKLGLVWEMMNQCFEPVIDRLTEENILKNVIYNTSSTLTRIDFKDFHTAILEKDDHIVAAACIRLRGPQIAEMPFVATHESCRRQGMLTKLMTAIETTLSDMNIEHLIITAAEDVLKMWREKFNFFDILPSMEFGIVVSKLLMFPNCIRLQKPLFQAKESKPLPFDLNLETSETELWNWGQF